MLREALEFLTNLGRQTVPDVVRVEAEPKHVYYLRGEDGVLTRTEAAPPPVAHQVDTLDTVADLASNGDRPVVWVRPLSVVVVTGEAGRDRATLNLSYSDPFLRLMEYAKQRPAIPQAVLIAELRTTFNGCYPTAGDLLGVLRKVRFNVNQTTVGEVKHGSASLGKEIQSQVYGTGDLPESLNLFVPVYSDPKLSSFREYIRCAFDPDPNTGNFRVVPLPGELEKATTAAAEFVAESIREKVTPDVRVRFGAP